MLYHCDILKSGTLFPENASGNAFLRMLADPFMSALMFSPSFVWYSPLWILFSSIDSKRFLTQNCLMVFYTFANVLCVNIRGQRDVYSLYLRGVDRFLHGMICLTTVFLYQPIIN